MSLLLDIAYLLALLLASPWLLWRALRQGKYRAGYAEKLLGRVPQLPATCRRIWFHAVSVGEVNLLAPLLRELQAQRPDWQCVLSTTTAAGMALARRKYPGLVSFYCPLDFSWAVRAAVSRIRPDLLVLVELELWPNLIRAAKRRGAKVAVINGRLSERSFRGYRWLRFLVRRVVGQLDLVAAQNQTYAARFLALGARPETVHVTGSIKYDGAQTDRDNPATQRLKRLAGFRPDDVVFLAGSTQEPEESIALNVFCKLAPRWPNLRLVLVPRHPERFAAVARLLDRAGVPWQRRTALAAEKGVADAAGAEAATAGDADRVKTPPRVLLVDTIGELGAWWGTAQIAFVGGSLGSRGGQNMIEPAAYGAAICFGPNTRNFRDVVHALLTADAAVVVHNATELAAFVERCLAEPELAAALGRRAQALVRSQLGASSRTCRLLESLCYAPCAAGPGAAQRAA